MEPQWIVDVLLPKVLLDAFPEGTRLVSHEIGAKKGGNAGDGGFASNTFQIKITAAAPGEDESSHYIIAKIFPQDPAMRAMHNSALQFHNEIVWYKEVVPAYEALAARFGLSVAHLWPKFFAYVDGALAAFVMQDLSSDGFGLAQPATSLSLEHAQIAMRKIGLLHALGYALQSHESAKNQQIVSTLKDTRFGPEAADGEQMDFLTSAAERGIGPLRTRPECNELVAALDRVFADALEMQRRVLTAHNDVTDVLCHGDFLRNNLLYKHDKDDKALDARLIDFATPRIASPCSDLALFLYISVDPNVLADDGLTNLLKTYYDALTDALEQMAKVKDPWRGNFQDLEKEFARCAPLAYSICAFFLPLMMAPSGEFQMEAMLEMSPEEQQKQNMNLGGPEATQRLIDMLIDFQKRGFYNLW